MVDAWQTSMSIPSFLSLTSTPLLARNVRTINVIKRPSDSMEHADGASNIVC